MSLISGSERNEESRKAMMKRPGPPRPWPSRAASRRADACPSVWRAVGHPPSLPVYGILKTARDHNRRFGPLAARREPAVTIRLQPAADRPRRADLCASASRRRWCTSTRGSRWRTTTRRATSSWRGGFSTASRRAGDRLAPCGCRCRTCSTRCRCRSTGLPHRLLRGRDLNRGLRAGGVLDCPSGAAGDGSRLGATMAVAVLALNPNLLYLQATPMTEPLLVATHHAGRCCGCTQWVTRGEPVVAARHRLGARSGVADAVRGVAGHGGGARRVGVGVVAARPAAARHARDWSPRSGRVPRCGARPVPGPEPRHGRRVVRDERLLRARSAAARQAVSDGAVDLVGHAPTERAWHRDRCGRRARRHDGDVAGAPRQGAMAAARSRCRRGDCCRMRRSSTGTRSAFATWCRWWRLRRSMPASAWALARRAGWAVAAVLAASIAIEAPPFDRHAAMIQEAQWDRPASEGRARVTRCLVAQWDHGTIMASMGSLAHYMQELSQRGVPNLAISFTRATATSGSPRSTRARPRTSTGSSSRSRRKAATCSRSSRTPVPRFSQTSHASATAEAWRCTDGRPLANAGPARPFLVPRWFVSRCSSLGCRS